jgi:hypothetical protein
MTSQPLVLITDSNIWIDLDHGGLLELITFSKIYRAGPRGFAEKSADSRNGSCGFGQLWIFTARDKLASV